MSREHGEVLAALAAAHPDRAIVVIGAAALRWHYPRFRGTLDLDLCIALDLDEHARGVGLPSNWVRQAGVPHRWRTEEGQILDVLPTADALLDAGRVEWPDGTVMDLIGLDLAMHDHHRFSEDLPANVAVATRRALFVAKIAAWLDRPAERQKDLGDLALLLDDYVDVDDVRRFDELVPADLDWSERPAFLLGNDVRVVGSARHLARIREFVGRVGDPDRRERHWLLQAAPAAWRADESALAARLRALLVGLGEA
jgi:predicted nucleotidyltransferase